MTGSGAGAKLKSAVNGGVAETDADGDRMIHPSLLLARHNQHPSWAFIALL
jgi:hypothetical protein